jgi:release factor glutamine methyltransferase
MLDAINILTRRLKPVSGDLARREAELILQELFGLSRTQLHLTRTLPIDEKKSAHIDEIVRRRLRHEPLPYILGKAYFHSRDFMVTPDVLIPRPDTEILVEAVLAREDGTARLFLDVGTGSGCIAAILLESRPAWRACASDVSVHALRVARENFSSVNRAMLLCADALTAFKAGGHFDFISANPPYIPAADISELDESVREFEPRIALDGGTRGVHFYQLMANEADRILKKGGHIYCEIGFQQGSTVHAIFETCGWNDIEVLRDLAGRERVVIARTKAGS